MKNTWKKIVATALAVSFVFAFAGCAGLSAYELAVQNGTFSGTEEEWLASLKGQDGEDGQDLDINDLYLAAKNNGYEGEFEDFLKEYLGSDSLDITENNNTAQLAENMMSVVSIQAFSAGSAGSGVIIDLDKENGNALIVTNYHVVYSAKMSASEWKKNIYVYLYGARDYETDDTGKTLTGYGDGMQASFLGGSLYYDVALLQVTNNEYLKESIATEAVMGDSDKAVVGEKVYAIGNPANYGIAITEGALSVDSEHIKLSMDVRYEITDRFPTQLLIQEQSFTYRVMRTDAAINSGNSGGALFNAKGELIGIVNAKTVVENIDNMAYALPITNVKYVIENLRANGGVVKRARMGVYLDVIKSKAKLDDFGNIYIEETIALGSFEKNEWGAVTSMAFGKLNEGDVFKTIRINDGEKKAVTRLFTIIDYMINVRKGDTVTFEIQTKSGVNKEVSFTFNQDSYFQTHI